MDDGKEEGPVAADGQGDLQVEAGGRGLADALQVGPADSLPSENTKEAGAAALFPVSSGARSGCRLNPSAMKASAGAPFFSCTSGVNLLPRLCPSQALILLQGCGSHSSWFLGGWPDLGGLHGMCPVGRHQQAGFETCHGLGDKERKMSTLKMLPLAFAKKRDFVPSTPAHSLARDMTASETSACKPQ